MSTQEATPTGGQFDRSPELDQFAEAMAAAQGEFETVAKTATNPFFKSKFADLPSVVKAAAPVLAKHGLSVCQLPGHDDGGDTLTTIVLHKSGQFVASTMRLRPVKDDPQSQGSATTYGRRYSYMAALGLVADEDDDGNAASASQANGGATRAASAQAPAPTEKTATAKQRGLINAKAGEKGLDSLQLATVVLAAAGNEPRDFDNPDAAQAWVNRQLDRLPARLVDPVLEGIAQADAEAIPF